jgi:hypothetical protein
MARTSSKAIIASPAAVRLNDLEVAMPPLLNLVFAPERWRCFLSLPTDYCRCHLFPGYHHLVGGCLSSEEPRTKL